MLLRYQDYLAVVWLAGASWINFHFEARHNVLRIYPVRLFASTLIKSATANILSYFFMSAGVTGAASITQWQLFSKSLSLLQQKYRLFLTIYWVVLACHIFRQQTKEFVQKISLSVRSFLKTEDFRGKKKLFHLISIHRVISNLICFALVVQELPPWIVINEAFFETIILHASHFSWLHPMMVGLMHANKYPFIDISIYGYSSLHFWGFLSTWREPMKS